MKIVDWTLAIRSPLRRSPLKLPLKHSCLVPEWLLGVIDGVDKTPRFECMLVLAVLAVLPVGNGHAQAPEPQAEQNALPAFTIMPQDEDWSIMRDPASRRTSLDRMKYIALEHEGSYLSIGGQIRERCERIQNDNWTAVPYSTNRFALQRYELHLDAHLLPQLRVFLQLHSGLEAGRPAGPRTIDSKSLDFLNAFIDVRPTGNAEGPTIRVGKQELNYGSGRGIAVREGPNVRQAFYGFRVDRHTSKWQMSGFAVRPAVDNFGYFNDLPDHTIEFWGWFNTRSWNHFSRHEFDVYYLGLDRKNAVFNRGQGSEVRHTFGTRISSEPPNDTADRRAILHYDFEAVYQGGTFRGGMIDAWTLSSESGVFLPKLWLTPRLDLRADVTSGDKNPNAKNLQTFNALFPIGNYFGILADTGPGPANLLDLHPRVRLNFPHRVDVYADWLIWWRDSLRDGVYGVPGNLLVAAGKSDARYVGNLPGLEVDWQIDRHAYLQADYGVFFAGPFLRQSGNGRNLNYAAASLGYRF